MGKTTSTALIIVAAASLWLAGTRHETLARMRMRYVPEPVASLENAPPLMVFTTIVFGGFRGLLADVLWLRASHLQEQGRYFELVQLSDWITKLEPRHTEVWAFHAWNMAYNASVMMPDPNDRWRWVMNGIDLLRREGLRYNPGDPMLYRELGWLFQNKIGGITDRDSMFYRRQWAREMTDLLGGAATGHDAPAAFPFTQRAAEEYGLLPGIIREIDTTYGPLDWRLPETHALYWAYRGRLVAGTRASLECDRMIYQALAMLFLQGRLLYHPENDIYLTSPNLDLLPAVIDAFDAARKRHGLTVDNGYENFLREAVLLLDVFGRREEALGVFDRLHGLFPCDDTDAGLETYLVRRREEASFSGMPKRRAIAVAEGLCYRSLLLLADGRQEDGRAMQRETERRWNSFLGEKNEEELERFGLPVFAQILEQAYVRAEMNDLPPDMRERLRAERLEQH